MRKTCSLVLSLVILGLLNCGEPVQAPSEKADAETAPAPIDDASDTVGLRVIVRNEAGKPIAGAQVAVESVDRGRPPLDPPGNPKPYGESVATDEQGAAFWHLPIEAAPKQRQQPEPEETVEMELQLTVRAEAYETYRRFFLQRSHCAKHIEVTLATTAAE